MTVLERDLIQRASSRANMEFCFPPRIGSVPRNRTAFATASLTISASTLGSKNRR